MEYKADKNAQEKILVARMLAEKNQKEDKECRSFDYYLIDELKQQIYDGEREHEETREELDNLKRIVQLHEEEEAQRRQEFRKLHTEVAMELLLGMKNVLEDANKARDIEKETTKDDVATLGMMAVYADLVGKVAHAFEKLMVY